MAQKLILRGTTLIKQTKMMAKWGGYMNVTDPSYSLIDPFIFIVHHVHSFRKGEDSGFPPHPHRGFETVTYIIEGGFDHGDSRGNKGRYMNGDVQWLTTGSGVLHSEMFVTDMDNPKFNGFQLWLNLPKSEKMCEPGYLMMLNEDIPVVTLTPKSAGELNEATNTAVAEGSGWVKVIHGNVNGSENITNRKTIVSYLHVRLEPNSSWARSTPSSLTAFAYVLSGEGVFGAKSQIVKKSQYVIFANDGNIAEIKNSSNANILDFVYLEGVPLKEPFAHQGPFVMSTAEEISQAFTDLQMGKFGEM